MSHYPTRERAAGIERKVIAHEHPVYNGGRRSAYGAPLGRAPSQAAILVRLGLHMICAAARILAGLLVIAVGVPIDTVRALAARRRSAVVYIAPEALGAAPSEPDSQSPRTRSTL